MLKERILSYLASSSDNAENEMMIGLDDGSLTNGNGVQRSNNRLSSSHSRGRKKDACQSYGGGAPLQDITSSRKYDNEPVASSTTQPTFEAFVMTGERVLKLTKNPSLMPKYQKKIDSLKTQNHRKNAFNQNYKFKSTPSSPVESDNSADMKSSSANTSPVSLTSPLQCDSTRGAERGSPFLSNISKSDDDIQYKKDVSVSTNSVQVDDDDLTSSLHTLLDTRSDSKAEDKRMLWTYNAPRHAAQSSSTIASSENVSSQHSMSPPSPTSVSSSVMSSMSSSTDRKRPQHSSNSIDLSQMEALSNISSPDYQEETSDMLNSHDIGMEVTDPSDSDSTLLVSEPKIRRLNKCVGVGSDNHELNGGIGAKYLANEKSQNHRVVIQVGIHDSVSMNYSIRPKEADFGVI